MKDDKKYRILQIRTSEELQNIQHAYNNLSLPTILQKKGDQVTALMEFKDEIEHPQSITQQELDDWIQRVQDTSVEFGTDIGATDTSLDNLIRYNGKLYWVDGNLMAAKTIDKQKAREFADHQRATLQRFVLH